MAKGTSGNMPADKKKFLEELKAAREYKDLDLARVSDRSKINLTYLEKMESGDWEFLPHAYVRSFLQTYIRIVGMDEAEVLEEFDRITGKAPTPTPQSHRESIEGTGEEKTREKPKEEKKERVKPEVQWKQGPSFSFLSSGTLLYVVIAVAVVVIGVVLITVLRPDEPQLTVEQPSEEPTELSSPSESQTSDDEIPFEEVVKDHDRIVERPAADTLAPPPEKPAQKTTAPVEVQIEAQDRCYIRVYADGQDSIAIAETVMRRGMERTFTAEEQLVLVLGSAGAVTIRANGTLIEEIGVVGQVAKLWVGPDGVQNLWRGKIPQPVDTTATEE
ncbi:DUF4115 domain-containing protein [bacterium]|nr:DUF4115 domain-containing protein [bacterium]